LLNLVLKRSPGTAWSRIRPGCAQFRVNELVRETARLVAKLTKMLRGQELALAAELTSPSLVLLWDDPGGPGKTQAASEWALRGRPGYERGQTK
jgi:hypothetical protein